MGVCVHTSMEYIYSLKQAEMWFRAQDEPVNCVKPSGEQRTCNTFDEAKNFYEGVSSTPTPEPPIEDNAPLSSSDDSSDDTDDASSDDSAAIAASSDPTPDAFESGGGDFGGAGSGSDW